MLTQEEKRSVTAQVIIHTRGYLFCFGCNEKTDELAIITAASMPMISVVNLRNALERLCLIGPDDGFWLRNGPNGLISFSIPLHTSKRRSLSAAASEHTYR